MEEQVGSPIEIIRHSLREESKRDREHRRSDLRNQNRRAIGDVTETVVSFQNVKEITDAASRLKQKNQVSVQELKKLKHAFILSEENAAAFLNVTGALHGLVRELSGTNAERRFAALNCCCNLALANEKLCHQLTKACASYLTPCLDGLNNVYLDTCLWTLGNMAGSGIKSWEVLRSQGALNKFLHLLKSTSVDVKESAIYATTLYVETGFDRIQSSEFKMLADHTYSMLGTEPDVYWLVFLLSCSSDANQVFFMNMVTSCVFDLLVNLVNTNPEPSVQHTTALLRTLGNLCGEESKQGVNEVLLLLGIQSVEFLTAMNLLLVSSYPHLQRETLWFLANLVKHCPEVIDILSSIEDRLKETLARHNTC